MTNPPSRRARYSVSLARLFQLIIDMPEEDRGRLLDELSRRLEGKDGETRRAHRRQDCLLTADCAVNGRLFRQFVQDISTGGMSIQVKGNFAVGQRLTLSFSFHPDDRPFRLEAEIVRVHEDGVGVKFLHLTALQKRVIDEMITKLGSRATG